MKTSRVLAAVSGLALASGALGQWVEQGDAGALPGTAQEVTGSGTLTTITGSNGAHDVDMYRIRICDYMHFEASTLGLATWDTQLWLFDGTTWTGITHNDDEVGGSLTLQSRLTSQFVTANGDYYLAISRYNRDARDGTNQLIWKTGSSVFHTERAPDGPGAANPIAGWSGATNVGGAYTINLTGCEFMPFTPFCEHFDQYALGSTLKTQGGWVPWPGGGNGLIVSGPPGSQSGLPCVEYQGGIPSTDCVHPLNFPVPLVGNPSKFYVSAMTRVPAGATGDGYIILCSAYNNGGFGTIWASQVKFSSAGVSNDAGGFGLAPTLPLLTNQWVQWEGMIDLAGNTFHDVYDCQQLTFFDPAGVRMKWSGNALNTAGPLAIAVVDLFSNNMQGMLVDDVVVTCAADLDQTGGCGVLNIFDFLAFFDKFACNNPIVCNCDFTSGVGVCDIFDFLCFQVDFDTCPCP